MSRSLKLANQIYGKFFVRFGYELTSKQFVEMQRLIFMELKRVLPASD